MTTATTSEACENNDEERGFETMSKRGISARAFGAQSFHDSVTRLAATTDNQQPVAKYDETAKYLEGMGLINGPEQREQAALVMASVLGGRQIWKCDQCDVEGTEPEMQNHTCDTQPPEAATPRPWTVSSGLFEKGSDYPAEREANIRLAVRCVNVHDKLIEALKACQTWLNQESCQHGDAEDGLLPPGPQSCLNCEVNEALKLARGE